VANLSKTLHVNFYQNRSTFAEVAWVGIRPAQRTPSLYLSLIGCSDAPAIRYDGQMKHDRKIVLLQCKQNIPTNGPSQVTPNSHPTQRML